MEQYSFKKHGVFPKESPKIISKAIFLFTKYAKKYILITRSQARYELILVEGREFSV